MEEDLILKKACLASGGAVRIPEGFKIPVRISRSTAGPGAGSGSVVFSFSGMRVKKPITHEESEFTLHSENGRLSILKNGELFIEDVSIIPVAYHCPEQAFFNLDQRCMFSCIYCTSPLLDRNVTKGLTPEKIAQMIRECSEPIDAIALTSGVFGSVSQTVDRMAECIRYLRSEFPELPIGVEPYIENNGQIDTLHDAGATEIKINCESAKKDIFIKACPELDYDNIFEMLAHAVDVFGKGSVASNIIVGLGESDEDLERIMVKLAAIGVAPGLRCLRIGDQVRDKMASVLEVKDTPSPERLVHLALIQKRIMSEYGLDSRTFRTMCFRCTCCDVTPFVDL